ncbi:multidrug efflux pump subunit AcrA (membrane-fusion protein) [Cereibacter changlensis]|uniref:Multidrug efflux pump subunit AcrA (Membrane-fusion protein) n=2 Tax=Cereibacter changlensis TaxID=402884 RepID=A0A2W7R6E8_9RHOB|nr:HlyD family efflux transporter periplasmic adaptor subunit [Cereibacter changlensis]PZX49689.1 multidrug efflux pump subunit AcrA (membrane-fusion protein) [Cereibacter changlensis]
MQSTQRDSADLGQALARHLGKLNGLIGCQAILRHEGGGWREVARLGRIASDGLEAELAGFDPQAGGTVRPLEGGKGWRAGYACAGPSVELFVALTLGEMPAAELQTRLTQIEQRIGWLLVEAERSVARSAQDAVLSTRIGAEVLIEAAEAASRAQLADQWIARLERALTPDLVAVCWVAGHAPKLAAISGGGLATQPSRQRSALEQLAEAAVEARGALILDAGDGPEEALAVLDAGRAMALPVYDGDPCRAAVVLLWRDPAAVLPDAEAAGLIARVLGEALTIQGRAHPALLRRFGNWLSGLARAIFGRRALKLKLAAVILAAGLLAAALTPSQHRPAFDARIEARDRQVIAAPFDGFLAAAPVQLGDAVAPGQELVRLEDSDLRLEGSRLAAEAEQLRTAMQNARAQRDTAELRNLTARLSQNTVEAALVGDQIARATVTADRDGLVVAGDAWKRVGSRVRLGDTLLQVASLDSLATLALIDEDWVADLPPEAPGVLLLAAWPDRPIPLHLQRITRETEATDGANAFVAWFDFEAPPEMALMDGMRGIIRVEAGPTTLLGRYGRGIGRWFERSLWRWR